MTTCFLPYLNPTSYLNLKACLYGIPFLQWKGWHELGCKYWRLSVSLTYKSVSITPSTRDTVTSKNLIEVFDFSAVNLMLGCTLLILSINDFNLFSPCSHKKNISSMYLHYRYCLYSDSFVIFSSISAINKMLYRGANLVPIAVPHFCLSVFFCIQIFKQTWIAFTWTLFFCFSVFIFFYDYQFLFSFSSLLWLLLLLLFLSLSLPLLSLHFQRSNFYFFSFYDSILSLYISNIFAF